MCMCARSTGQAHYIQKLGKDIGYWGGGRRHNGQATSVLAVGV